MARSLALRRLGLFLFFITYCIFMSLSSTSATSDHPILPFLCMLFPQPQASVSILMFILHLFALARSICFFEYFICMPRRLFPFNSFSICLFLHLFMYIMSFIYFHSYVSGFHPWRLFPFLYINYFYFYVAAFGLGVCSQFILSFNFYSASANISFLGLQPCNPFK